MFERLRKFRKLRAVPLIEAEREARTDVILRVVVKIVVLVDVGFVALAYLEPESVFFWLLFLAFLFFGWDARYTGALAILALTACPILLSLEWQAEAEQMAVYAYYLLVMTVVLQIIEFKRHPERFGEKEERETKPPLDLRSHKSSML